MNNLLKCIAKLLSIEVFFQSYHVWAPKQKIIVNLLEGRWESVILVSIKSESNSLTMTQTSFQRKNTTITCIFGSPPKRFLIALTISESEGVQDLVSKSRVLATSSLRDQVTISPPPMLVWIPKSVLGARCVQCASRRRGDPPHMNFLYASFTSGSHLSELISGC